MNEIIEASHPGFIRVVPKVDAVNERHLLRRDVSHVDVDVENEIRDFLHANPGDVLGILSAMMSSVCMDHQKVSPDHVSEYWQTVVKTDNGG